MVTQQERAQGAKDKGNAAFKAGDFPTAIGHYTAAFMADPSEPTYALNRAAAYLKLGKYEDAERDCTTVLGLSSKNVKALFRRGQARAELGRLDEAQADFSAVLSTEPTNTAARDELTRVKNLASQKEKAKKPKVAMDVPLTNGATDQQRKRRVPIKIIDPSAKTSVASTSTPPAQTSTPIVPKPPGEAPKTTSPRQTDTLEAVSSRSLKEPTPPSSSSTVPPAIAAAAASLEREFGEVKIHAKPPPADASKGSPGGADNASEIDKGKGKARAVPESFAQAKQERASAKPSRVGGGIFRSNGASTLFSPRSDSENTSRIEEIKDVLMASPSPSPAPAAAPLRDPQWAATPSNVNGVPAKAPSTLFDFTRAWKSAATPATKWALLTTVPPASLPALCKTSLEPDLLGSMMEVFQAALEAHPVGSADASGVRGAVRAYVEALARIPRIGTVVLLLSAREKAVARSVLDGLDMSRPSGVWAAIA